MNNVILLSLQFILIYMGRIVITITTKLSPYTKSMYYPSHLLACLNLLGLRSGRQTRKRQRAEDSSPSNGNSKRRCVNKGSSTSGRDGMSNTDNTRSGKYCVTFFKLNFHLHLGKNTTTTK